MTASEWRTCQDPVRMLEYLRGKVSDRKLRLYACACCAALVVAARPPGIVTGFRRLLCASERWADGQLTEVERASLTPKLRGLRAAGARFLDTVGDTASFAVDVVGATLLTDAFGSAVGLVRAVGAVHFGVHSFGFGRHSLLLRPLHEIFGDPFCHRPVDPCWLPPDVQALARAAYEERTLLAGTLDRARLTVLSDALEEAGCDDADLLSHLRALGPHPRGCWALDSVSGKS